LVSALGQTLQVPLTQDEPVDQLAAALACRGRIIVILDNLEQVLDAARHALRVWMEETMQVVFVLTSRQPLALQREEVVWLEPFEPPSDDVLETLLENDAVRLFLTRARREARPFSLNKKNAASVAALMRALDGLPLAIEFAAARIQVMSPAVMLAKLHRRFDLLTSRRRDLSPRQTTLLGTLEWSWNLLDPWEQAALTQIAVFEGSFSLTAAEAVIELSSYPDAPFVLDVLESLVDKSLLRSLTHDERDQPLDDVRFSTLVSVHAFARSHLDALDRDTRDNIEHRHGEFFSRLHMDYADSVDGLLPEHVRALSVDRDNLVAASERAVGRADATVALATLSLAHEIYDLNGPFHPGVEVMSRALSGATWADDTRGRILALRGRLLSRMGDLERARDDLEAALQALQPHSNTYDTSVCVETLAMIDHMAGDFDTALVRYQQAIHLAKQSKHVRSECRWFMNLGLLEKIQGRVGRARTYYTAAIEHARRLHDTRFESLALGGLASLDHEQGHTLRAAHQLQEALHLATQAGDRRAESIHRGNLAAFDEDLGRIDAARHGYTQVLTTPARK